MTLTNSQIESLFAFTRKKYVHYYDLQIEIVDHLASEVEEMMEKDLSLSFEAALDRVYKRFGIFGFSKIVQEREKQLYRKVQKQWWGYFFKLFKWPLAIKSLAFLLTTYTIIHNVSEAALPFIVLGVWLAGMAIHVYNHKKVLKPKKPLLLMAHIPGFPLIFVFGYQAMLLNSLGIPNPWYITAIIFLGFLTMTADIHITKQIRTEALKQYPAAFA